jgi:hypothetical protein
MARYVRTTSATTAIATSATDEGVDTLSLPLPLPLELGDVVGELGTDPASGGNTVNVASDRQNVADRTSAVAAQDPSSPGWETNV